MTQKEIRLTAIIATSVIILLGIGAFWIVSEKKKIEADKLNIAKEMKEEMQDELDRLSEEYNIQYNKLVKNSGGELNLQLSSDSLANQLIAERTKVNRLLEELNAVKASNNKRIGQLKDEVKTLRNVLKSYVIQIDSLNASNERLRKENTTVKADLERVTTEASQLKKERTELAGKVSLAAKLITSNITARLLDGRGRATKNINRAENIEVSFTVAKNITAQVGEKTFYARILNPNDEPLTIGGGMVKFEGGNVAYSCKKTVEYGGDEMRITMYYAVTQALLRGPYRLYLIADGNEIGMKTFEL